jgi:hypothetical protein
MALPPGTIELYTPAAGDASYSWNSKNLSPAGYGTGDDQIGIYLSFGGGQYGNDHTVSIFEIPIGQLAGKPLTSAMLVVNAMKFGTNYDYGSAMIGWLDTGTATLTGDILADNLGPAATSRPGGFTIWGSGAAYEPGLKYFDVKSCVQADLAAGRSYSTFVMSGSRDTYGSIYTAESGFGPYIQATVPEPASMLALGAGLAGMLLRRRRKA